MSYDLSIRPRPGTSEHRISLEAAVAAIRASRAEAVSGASARFRFHDRLAGEATADLVSAGATAERIEVSVASTDSVPVDVYLFCATVARKLSWSVFDPQGDCWYSPADLAKATNTADGGDTDTTVGARTLLSGVLLLVLVVVWLIRGMPSSRNWVAVLIIVSGLTLVARVWDYLESVRHRKGGAGS